ncbi:MAG: Holliday junction resolvase RuvX [Puniceicoccaceae bacterium]
MRCLGIDYGEKRIGLAWGDELGVATPLAAAVESSPEDRMAHIEELVNSRKPTDLVVGYPYNMDGTVGFKAKEVDAFIEILVAKFSLPVHRIDERLTSQRVESDLGLNARRERELRKTGIVDSGAAALILQDWLDMQLPAPELPDPFDEDDFES